MVAADHRTAAFCALAASVLLWISAIFYMKGYYTEFGHRDIKGKSWDLYVHLDPATLQTIWTARREAGMSYLVGEMVGAVAWFLITIPVGSMVALMGGELRSATRIVTSCFTGVAFLTLIEMTFQAGTIGTTDWLSSWDIMKNATAHNGDGGFGPLQSLEIACLVGKSRTEWAFAVDELLMCIGCGVTTFLALTTPRAILSEPFHKCWAYFTAFLSFVTFISFALSGARRLAWFKLTIAAGFGTVSIYMVLLPIWLIWLGIQLRDRSEPDAFYENTITDRPPGEMDANKNLEDVPSKSSTDVEMAERA